MQTMMFMLCCIFTIAARAQLSRSPLYMRYLESGAYSLHFTDVFSVTGNQAALARLHTPAAGLYTERRYMLKALNSCTAVVGVPFRHSGAAFLCDYSGSATYHEARLGLAYGRTLGKAIDLGVQVNYMMRGIEGYGNTADINVEIGAMMHFSEKVHAGFHLYNPAAMVQANHLKEKLPAVYTMGFGYEASDKLFCSTTVGKAAAEPVNVNAMMQYAFVPRFFIRAGIATATGSYFAGAGMTRDRCRMDVAVTYHPQLGVTPSLLLIFQGRQNRGKEE